MLLQNDLIKDIIIKHSNDLPFKGKTLHYCSSDNLINTIDFHIRFLNNLNAWSYISRYQYKQNKQYTIYCYDSHNIWIYLFSEDILNELEQCDQSLLRGMEYYYIYDISDYILELLIFNENIMACWVYNKDRSLYRETILDKHSLNKYLKQYNINESVLREINSILCLYKLSGV